MKKIRIISGILACSLILNANAYALITPTYKAKQQIAQSASYTYQQGSDSNGLQSSNFIEYFPNEYVKPKIVSGNNVQSSFTINYAISWLQDRGHNVIGGINADFYTMSTGVPTGIIMQDGELVSSDGWQQAVAFKNDGTAFIDRPGMNMRLYYTNAEGASDFVQINYFNKTRSSSYVYLYNERFHDDTKVTTSGTDIILERIDTNKLTPRSELEVRVVDIKTNNKATTLNDNQFVLSIDNKMIDSVPPVAIGDTMKLITNVSNDAWTDVDCAVGAGTVLLENGEIASGASTSGTNPRSAVGIKADGTIVLYEVDGRQSSFSNGLSLYNLAVELKNMGCVSAVNLDGGGSSTFATRFPGTSSMTVTNSPSEGSLRSNANYIMLVNTAPQTGILSNLHIYPDSYLLLKNASVNLDIKATDTGFFTVSAPSDIEITDHLGNIYENNTFTAPTTGYFDISATYGDIKGMTTVRALENVDGFTVYNQNSKEQIQSLVLDQNGMIDLTAVATFQNNTIPSSDTSYNWSVKGDIGTIDANGLFLATDKYSTGSIYVTYGNQARDIPVTIGLAPQLSTDVIFDFETNKNFNSSIATQSYEEVNVAFSKRSLKVSYDFSNANSNTLSTDINVTNHSHLNFKIDGSSVDLYALFETVSGEILKVYTETTGNGYLSKTVEIPSNAYLFKGFELSKTSSTKGDVYFDDIILSNEANDNKGPVLSNFGNASVSNKTVTLSGNIIDNGTYLDKSSITVKLNNSPIDFTYSTKLANVSISNNNTLNGLNKITITAVDNFNNITEQSFDFTVPYTSTKFQDISENWAKDYINYADNTGIVTGEQIGDFFYFNPSRNITRTEFAVIIARYLDLDISKTSSDSYSFADINSIPTWAVPYVYAVAEAGIMTGSFVGDKLYFNPNSSITRAEVITVLGRTIDNGFDRKTVNFTDSSSIPSWASEYFTRLYSKGVIDGYSDGSIKPLNSITRAEVCKLIFTLV